ncbi:hypothetical protein BX666DRAFT_1922330 [Dichotomocladium elegans]|nr:hypothetical protein BX666DRAFT_1922330 [Dichotomocladium elegans]
MFSKSIIRMDHFRPRWFSASDSPATDDEVTLATILNMDQWPHLAHLAEVWQGPISAVLQVPTGGSELGSGAMLENLSKIRLEYKKDPFLARHVDLHLIARPSRSDNGQSIVDVDRQDARNLARLFSRTKYVAHVPVTALWMTDLASSARQFADRMDRGDVLIVPTFGFPRTHDPVVDVWPTSKQEMTEWVDRARMGLLDYHWHLNDGPTSYAHWREATEPYLVPKYDFHYSPVYIATRDGHPWCDERFADEPSACLYSIYLSGANLWVLPEDYIVRTGQEPENHLSADERTRQVKIYKNYRIEQCVFYARQYDQSGLFNEERAKHVHEECAKELGNLRREKMIGPQH